MWSAPYVEGQAVTLLDLPPELILHICQSSTDWRVIFTLEKICKDLKETLSDRSAWTYLVSICLNPPFFGPRINFLNRPIATYTASELRSLFVRWKKIEQGWQHADVRTFKSRTLELHSHIHPYNVILVPGGRWVIFFAEDCSAVSFDLDCQILSPTPLIPPQWPCPGAHSCVPFDISKPDIDNSSPSSGIVFRFAVSYKVIYDDGTGDLPVIQIWNISSLHDVDTDAETLEAEKIAELTIDLDYGPVYVFALEGDMVLLQATDFSHGSLFGCFLVNWLKVRDNPEEPSCRLFIVNSSWSDAKILDDDVLLWNSNDSTILTCTTYKAVPQLPLSELRRYRHASAISEVHPGQDIAFEIPGCPSEPDYMSRVSCGLDNALRPIKTLFLVDQRGQFFVVIYSGNNMETVYSPSISCLPLKSNQATAFDLGIMGHSVAVFTDDDFNLKVANYPDVLCDIYKNLSEGHINIQTPSDTELFVKLQTVTVLDMNAVAVYDKDVNIQEFDEGIGRILIFDARTRDLNILDLDV